MTATVVHAPQTAIDVRATGRQLASQTTVVDGRGRTWQRRLSPDQQAALFSRIVHRGAIGLVELAAGRLTADGRLAFERGRWHDGHYPAAADTAAFERIARGFRARGLNVFTTPLAKSRPEPNDDHITSGQVVWVDLDDVDERPASERLAALRPHLLVGSGGGLHAYWRLARPLPADAIESLNRRLAAHLDGDPQVTNRGRLMRLPGSWNERRQRPCRTLRIDHGRPPVTGVELEQLGPDPAPPEPRVSLPARRTCRRDELDQLSPRDYFRLLIGIEVPRDGFIPCPIHHERAPSCKVYDTAARGWWCYGCMRGGRIYDLVSLLDSGPSGRDLHGERFLEVKARTFELLGIPAPTSTTRSTHPDRQPKRGGCG